MKLTKHPQGSLFELWTIAFPLMISSLSVLTMLFIDRLLLANYSTKALNASVNAGTLGWAFVVGWMVLTSIAEVFVAQYNGAGKPEKIGAPVWQMIWLSFASYLFFFIPFSFFLTPLIYGETQILEREYLFWMMIFGPSYGLYAALSAFFIGQGKTKLITFLAIATNFVNAFLDLALIFGVDGLIPSMGVKGAAIATSMSSLFQVFVLMAIFLNRKNRQTRGTSNYHFNYQQFMSCIRIGLPNALVVTLEILGWAVFYALMTKAGEKYITVVGITQSLLIFLWFFPEGIQKAVITLSGNYIGADQKQWIPNLVRSGMILLVGFFLVSTLFLALFNEIILQAFLTDPKQIAELSDTIAICLYITICYLFFDGVRLLYYGVLTAAGDTLFQLLTSTVIIWIFLIIPVYWIVVVNGASVVTACLISLFFSILSAGIYYGRYLMGKWKKLSLMTTS